MNIKRILWIIFLLGIILIYNYIQIAIFHINNVKLYSNKVSKSLRITQISDFHSNQHIDLNELFNKISEFNPNIIVLTGDLIDKNTKDLDIAIKLLEKTKKISDDVYFVSGNHETNNKLSYELYNAMEELDVKHLDHKAEKIKINGNSINIFGVPFYVIREDFNLLYENISEKEYNLLLSHSPNKPINYLNKNIDLILSGHTHGGQVRIPIIGGVLAPGQGLFPKYDKGLYKIGNTSLYIDSGLGNSLLPIRMFNRVQISNIEVLAEN